VSADKGRGVVLGGLEYTPHPDSLAALLRKLATHVKEYAQSILQDEDWQVLTDERNKSLRLGEDEALPLYCCSEMAGETAAISISERSKKSRKQAVDDLLKD